MKTTTKYVITDENNFEFENRVTGGFGDAALSERDMTFSYVFTMDDGEELLHQKVYNCNGKFENDGSTTDIDATTFINGEEAVDSFTEYQNRQRDRLSSAASTVDETGSDDFVINHEGESRFHPYPATLSENDDQDCFIIDEIFPTNNVQYKESGRFENQNIFTPKFNRHDSSSTTNDNEDGSFVIYDHNYVSSTFKNAEPFKDSNEENSVKMYNDYGKPENRLNDVILTLFDNTSIDNKCGKVDIKNSRDGGFYTNSLNQSIINDHDTGSVRLSNRTDEYQTNKWFSPDEMYSYTKQDTSNNGSIMINCDESSSIPSSSSCDESSSIVNKSDRIDGFKGFKGSYDYETNINDNRNGSSTDIRSPIMEERNSSLPLPPIETVLLQGVSTRGRIRTLFNSTIRKNPSSLNCNSKAIDNGPGEFGHLSCGQHWQESAVNDINCNISNNQVIVSQSEGASIDLYSKVKEEDVPPEERKLATSIIMRKRWDSKKAPDTGSKKKFRSP